MAPEAVGSTSSLTVGNGRGTTDGEMALSFHVVWRSPPVILRRAAGLNLIRTTSKLAQYVTPRQVTPTWAAANCLLDAISLTVGKTPP